MSEVENSVPLSDGEEVPFAESFEVMKDDLVALGAGERAIAGTVVDEDNAAFRAGYRLLSQPPRIIQVSLAPGMDAYTVTRVRVDAASNRPKVEVERQTVDITDDVALLAEMHANDTDMVTLGSRGAEATFDQVYFNLEDFLSDDQPG